MTGSPNRNSGAKLTYDDLVTMPDDGLRRELIDGELYVTPSPTFVSRSRESEVLAEEHLVGAPDLVVEVGSPSTRRTDERAKQRLYERFAVAEYWIVDPDLDAIKVFRLVEGRYQRLAELALEAGDVLSTPLLPDLEMPLSEIFED